MRTLGIDLGSNSLGWAVVDAAQGTIIKTGVVLFDEGILRKKGNDSIKTPASERQNIRAARRLKFRRRLRKFHTLKLLIENQMCPLSLEEAKLWLQGKKYPIDNKAFQTWLQSDEQINPYFFRAQAATTKIPPMQLGRALFHIAQRRGFLSSRKDQNEASEEEKADKKLGEVKDSIRALSTKLEERKLTLGQLFFEEMKTGEKIRGQYTGRKEHYYKEFDQICKIQGIDDELKKRLWKALFLQRPLRSQKHLVGYCELEDKRTRCQISHPLFEEYRMLQIVNNIRIGEEKRPLLKDEREKVINCFYKKSDFKFESIIKALYSKVTLAPLFNYKANISLSCCKTGASLRAILGDHWQAFDHEYTKDNGSKGRINIQGVYDALLFFADSDQLKAFAKNRLGLDEEKALALSKIKLPEGYANYSLYAIKKILVFLRQGYELSTAKVLAKLPDLLGERWSQQGEQIACDIMQLIKDYRKQDVHFLKKTTLKSRLITFFETDLKLTKKQIEKLYWHEEKNPYSKVNLEEKEKLPIVNLGMIKNPLVQRSLTQLRRLVNHLRKIGLIDAETIIHIELARSVNDRNTRMAYETWQKKQEAQRENAREKIIEQNIEPTEDLILRYILWDEQGEKCLYTGKNISLKDLLTESGFDIEHTIPRSRSGDNSRANKTICDAHYNRTIKCGKIPTECQNYGSEISTRIKPWIKKVDELEKRYNDEKIAVKKVPKDNMDLRANKRQTMLATKFELDYWRKKVKYLTINEEHLSNELGFMNRQLVDTGVMTRHAQQFLGSIYKTYAVNGVVVAWAREAWGLQEAFTKKERTDHVHHAIDAIVIACLSRDEFEQIAKYHRDDGVFARAHQKYHQAPWEKFQEDVISTTDDILVRYIARHVETKPTKKRVHLVTPTKDGHKVVQSQGDSVRGQLHKESFYGCIQLPPNHSERKTDGDEKRFVITKPLDSLKDCEEIVDEVVREKVIQQAQAYKQKGVAEKKPFSEIYWMNKEKGVRIKKVRVFAKPTNPNVIKTHSHVSKHDYKNPYYVETAQGANFMLALYKKSELDKKGNPAYDAIAITLLDFTQDDYVPPEKRKEDGEFIGIIQPGTLALAYETAPQELYAMTKKQLSKRLYKVRWYSNQITLDYHRDARPTGEKGSGTNKFDYIHGRKSIQLMSEAVYNYFIFEGIDFELSLDGEITFLNKER